MAITWYRLAAEHGHSKAQFNLASMYYCGQGVSADLEQAFLWFRKAAQQGLMKAQCNLGAMYTTGAGVPKDVAEASRWNELANANRSDKAKLGGSFDSSETKDAESVGSLVDMKGEWSLPMEPVAPAAHEPLTPRWDFEKTCRQYPHVLT